MNRLKIALSSLICLVMIVASIPVVIGEEPYESFIVERTTPGGPKDDAVTISWTTDNNCYLYLKVEDHGLSGVRIEISDITDGAPILLLSERIGFGGDKYGTKVSIRINVMAGVIYSITAVPSGKNGAYAVVTPITEVGVLLPVAIINASDIAYIGEPVIIDGSSSYDADGMIVEWLWDFGDGTTGTGEVVTHVYAVEGIYTISLVVIDDMGLKSNPATKSIDIRGPSYSTYTISEMFDYYPKSPDYDDMGRHKKGIITIDDGWWPIREWNYGEVVIVRNSYPYVLAWPVYSANTAPASSATDAGFALSSFYRLQVNKYYLSEIGTGPERDPLFIPILDATNWGGTSIEERMAWDGGTIQFSYFGTYLTYQEIIDIRDGIHYANWYYGVKRFPLLQDDGWWWEQQGTISFDITAARKFLGLQGTGDLREEFRSANGVGDVPDPSWGEMSLAWQNDWMREGGSGGIRDIYTAYDYSLDIRYTGLTLDPSSTSDTLVLRLYSVSWGNEMLLMRYLEAANVVPYWQTYNEDFSIDGVISSNSGDISVDCFTVYHLTASMDPSYDVPCWSLEGTHVDNCGNVRFHEGYPSPFNPYDSDIHPDATKMSTLPGTVNFGQQVNYWYTPLEWDLSIGESLMIELPTATVGGYLPQPGTGIMTDANDLWVEGTLELGTGDVELGSYDPETRILTFHGPIDFPTHTNPLYPSLLESGSPTLNFIVI